LYFSGFTALLD